MRKTLGRTVFKDNFVHLGGDEVNTGCWDSTPSVAAWLKKEGMTADDGYAYFVLTAPGMEFCAEGDEMAVRVQCITDGYSESEWKTTTFPCA